MSRIPLEHRQTPMVRFVQWVNRRKFGAQLDPGLVALHNRRVLLTMALTESTVTRWKSLDPTLTALATMGPAALIGCSWCLDFGYWEHHHRGVPAEKLRAVSNWRDSDVYTDLERKVLAYAEAMTVTPPQVTDEMVEQLRAELTDEQVVELTAMIALENQRSRNNAAAGLTGQGFKEQCELRPA
ncbi:carboxymuconolactone decarboxylase family protein [Kribbella deserti]|uniref:Carboxymuconolactone decarboxylase family protein n=1 Tax=Kribbella deserti TaxID=1926257 RepID=A0ABV6QXQ0_9ACTN